MLQRQRSEAQWEEVRYQESAEVVALIDNIWHKYDDDKNGALDREETRKFLQETFGNLGQAEQLGELGDEDYFDSIFAALDADGSGTVDKAEMAEFVKRMHHNIKVRRGNGIP